MTLDRDGLLLSSAYNYLISAREELDKIDNATIHFTVGIPLNLTIAHAENEMSKGDPDLETTGSQEEDNTKVTDVPPSHACPSDRDYYRANGMEAIDIIEAYGLGFHLGNVIKYILRAGRKTDIPDEDIDKAIWYLNRYKEARQ